jgi:PIN domain nuclease of toxin-antitoxin system
MKILLDTHVALWAIIDDPRLPVHARNLIDDPGNDVNVSTASLWEIAIKHALSRGASTDMPVSARAALGYFLQAGYALLSISPEHAVTVADLPLHHADPFDRILIAQAISEPMRLMTRDRRLAVYSDVVIQV